MAIGNFSRAIARLPHSWRVYETQKAGMRGHHTQRGSKRLFHMQALGGIKYIFLTHRDDGEPQMFSLTPILVSDLWPAWLVD